MALRPPSRRAPASGLSDAELIELTRSGDTAAFAELWTRHAPSARTVARSYTSSLDPDDLVSEAFAKVFQAIRKGGGPTGAFRPYLFTTVRNTAAEWGRKRQETSIDTLESFEDPAFSEEKTLEALDRSLTARAFQSLPTRWQEALWYSEVEGMTPQEMAPLLGMKANAVSALCYRAREGLRQAWIQSHLNAAPADSDCRWTIERLAAYTRGGTGIREARRVEEHLDGCAKCTIVAAEAKDVDSRLALVLLPLAAGVAGASGYLAWLQAGAPAATMAMGAAGASSLAGSTGATIGAGAGGTGAGSGAGGAAGGGASAGAGAAAGATAGAAAGTSVATGVIVGTVATALVAAGIATAVTLGPAIWAPPTSEPVAGAEQGMVPAPSDAGDIDSRAPAAAPQTPVVEQAPVTPEVPVPIRDPRPVPESPTGPTAPIMSAEPQQPVAPQKPTDPPPPIVPETPTDPEEPTDPEPPTDPVVLPPVVTPGDAPSWLYPELRGTAEPGATISFQVTTIDDVPVTQQIDGRPIEGAAADDTGVWVAPPLALPSGQYLVQAIQTDPSGTVSEASAAAPIEVAKTPEILQPTPDALIVGIVNIPVRLSYAEGATVEVCLLGGSSPSCVTVTGRTTLDLPIGSGPQIGARTISVRYTDPADPSRLGPAHSIDVFMIGIGLS